MAKGASFPASRELFKLVRYLADNHDVEVKFTDIDIGRIIGFESARTSRWKHGQIAVNDAPRLVALAHAFDIDFTLLSHVAAGYLTSREAITIAQSESEFTHFVSEQMLLPQDSRAMTLKSSDGTQIRISRLGPGRYDRKTQRGSSLLGEPDAAEHHALLVDDDPMAINIFNNLTGPGTGIIGHVARSGAEALLMAGEYKPQLILFDVFIGDVDGFKAIRALSSNKGTRTALVVATSLTVTQEIVRLCYGTGAVDVQPRPLEASTIERILERSRRQEIA